MKAAVLHAPGDLRYEDYPVPVPKETDVILRVRAAGNCGSDLQRIMVKGTYHFPCIPGHEFSGEIVEIGSKVKSFNVGDAVTAAPLIPCRCCRWCQVGEYNLCESYDYLGSRSDGAFAEYVKVPAENLFRIPEGVDFEEAANTDPICVALHGIRRSGGINPGDTVVILGAGPIGMYACQWAKILGASKVIAVDVIPKKLEICHDLGVDATINAIEEDVVSRCREETDGGADLVMETAGTLATQQQSLLIPRKRGRVVSIGRSYKDVLLPDKVYTQIFRRELIIYGSVNSNFVENGNEWKISLIFLARGLIKVKPLISHRLPLSEAGEMFRKMYEKKIYYNKIIFQP